MEISVLYYYGILRKTYSFPRDGGSFHYSGKG